MTRSPATIARDLTRAQRHSLVQALEMGAGPFKGKWYLRVRADTRVRRVRIAQGLVSKRDGSFLTRLGEQVRTSLSTDPVEHARHHFHGAAMTGQVQQ